MGQSAIAVMYGCEVPKNLDLYGENDRKKPGPNLIEGFEKFSGTGWPARGQRVETFADGARYMVGVLVAIGRSGKIGAADLWEERRVSDLATLPEAETARALWDRFVAWCKTEHAIDLPAADLWIVPRQTA